MFYQKYSYEQYNGNELKMISIMKHALTNVYHKGVNMNMIEISFEATDYTIENMNLSKPPTLSPL